VINSIRHFGIVVRDLQAALNFWVGVLGWEIRADVLEPSPFIDELISVTNPELRTVKISDGSSAMVELLHFSETPESANSPEHWPGDLSQVGPTHVAVTVGNIEKIMRAAMDIGYRPLSRIMTAPISGVKVVFIRSQEGIMIELVQP
jgi:catechol 2,3-dioxygenase-like lactoylglutathione lyase family enzyme